MVKISQRIKELKTAREAQQGSAPHVIVKALAGTGKTFSLIVGVGQTVLPERTIAKGVGFRPIPSPEQQAVWDLLKMESPRFITYIAFNKSIVVEFGEKWAWMTEALQRRNVSLGFSTVHSLGFRACCQAYDLTFRNINQWKTRNILEKELGQDVREVFNERPVFVQACEALTSKVKINLVDPDPESLDKLATHYEIALEGDREEVFEMVPKLIERSRTDLNEIDFDDQLWLPVVNDLPVRQSDLLLVDEGQDLNRCQQELAMKAGKRIVLVGDVNQAIYGFAGADVDSIPNMTGFLASTPRGVQEVPLTVTRRCGKAIVREAQEDVPAFKAHETNGEGEVKRIDADKVQTVADDKDLVLCRVNAPLIGFAFARLRAGKKVNIQGRNIGAGLKSLIKKSKAKDVDAFLSWLEDFLSTEMDRLSKRKNPSEEAKVALKDKVECLRVFSEGALTIKEINENIDKLFQGKKCPSCGRTFNDHDTVCTNRKGGCEGTKLVRPEGVLASSIHRAKGLEADRVFILHPELIPHPMAKTDWAVRQEYNLRYVARTRAIKELVYVDGAVAE